VKTICLDAPSLACRFNRCSAIYWPLDQERPTGDFSSETSRLARGGRIDLPDMEMDIDMGSRVAANMQISDRCIKNNF